jgi:hypothetical protein
LAPQTEKLAGEGVGVCEGKGYGGVLWSVLPTYSHCIELIKQQIANLAWLSIRALTEKQKHGCIRERQANNYNPAPERNRKKI